MASSGKHEVEEQGVTISTPETKTNAEKLKIYNPALTSVRLEITVLILINRTALVNAPHPLASYSENNIILT